MVNKRGYVYFVQQGKDGPIKIGKAKNPRSRLSDLQVSSPFKLVPRLLVCDQDLERRFHEMFSRLYIRGEWFNPGNHLTEYISHARKSAWGSMDIRGCDVPIAEYCEFALSPLQD